MAQYFDPKQTALQNIEALRRIIRSGDFRDEEKYPPEERRAIYIAITAMRMAVDAKRDKKATLKTPQSQENFNTAYETLANCTAFGAFLEAKGEEEVRRLLTKGHGGALEDEFQSYVLKYDVLPTDTPMRYMPNADKRIEHLQEKLKPLGANSPEAVTAYAELFRARRAVNAVRNKGNSLETPVTGAALAQTPDLANNDSFRRFVQERGAELKAAAAKGHGGAAEDLFKDHLLHQDALAADAPQAYAPQALARIEALQEKINSSDYLSSDKARRLGLCAELLAARAAAEALRGDKHSLEKTLDPAAAAAAAEQFKQSATFQAFFDANEAEVRKAAAAGHGGALEDRFRDYVTKLDVLPADVPARCMPNALERAEALQEKLRASSFTASNDERKQALLCELLATRSAVGALRGERKTLETSIDPEKLAQEREAFLGSETVRNYLKDHEREARQAAISGHGGALEDKLREHVNTLDVIPADVPKSCLPQAITRTETLQQKLSNRELDANERFDLYCELLATRESVGAVRGKKDSLRKQISMEELDAARDRWKGCETFRSFLQDNPEEALRAATSGHGGALEDKLRAHVRSQDRIPADIPDAYMPSALERTEALTNRFRSDFFEELEPDQKRELMAELFAARRSVEAVRGKKASLDKPLKAADLDRQRKDLLDSPTFQRFMDPDANPEYDKALQAARTGHGGAAEDCFRDYVKGLDHIAQDVPPAYLPTALERTEALQQKIAGPNFAGLEADQKVALLAELLASRSSVEAVRGEKKSLDKTLDAAQLQARYDELTQNPTFRAYVTAPAGRAAELACRGHGGALEDGFREYVRDLNVLPAKLPQGTAPTAQERIEALQRKIKAADFGSKTPEEKELLLTELVATRMAAQAQRGKKSSLAEPLSPEAVEEARKSLGESETFKQFLREDPAAVREAALEGHGGALEERFQGYVLNRDQITPDVPDRYMPTALERTEALQKKIEARDFPGRSQQQQSELYMELMATRAAVNSERGSKESLRVPLSARKLDEAWTQLAGNALGEFLQHEPPEKLRKAALSGHGGALEDKFRDDLLRQTLAAGSLPEGVAPRWQPKPAELTDHVRQDLKTRLKTMNAQNAEPQREALKREVACLMYLSKLQAENARRGRSNEPIDAGKMRQSVDALCSSQAFGRMFENEAAIRQTAETAVRGASGLFETFARHGGRLQPQPNHPQPQRQLQNQRQNQPAPAQNGLQV